MDRISKLLHLENNTPCQAISPPIYQTATFNQHDANAFKYSRVKNPTRDYLEQQLAILDNADSAFAVSSGLAAINVILDGLTAQDEVIVDLDFYAGLTSILKNHALTRDIKVKQVDLQCVTSLQKAITAKTKIVFCESLSNPLQRICPIHEIARITQKTGICLVVDNSLLSSYSFMPLNFGADIVIQSATKYLSGHADITAGVIATHCKYHQQIAQTIGRLGCALDPFQSWLLSRSLKTLHLRLQQQHQNTQMLYQWLMGEQLFSKILYAGAKSSPYGQWLQQNSLALGCLLGIECSNHSQLNRLTQELKSYFPKTVSFGAVHSSMSHPDSMSHSNVDTLPEISLKVSPYLLRLSIGCEPIADIISIFKAFSAGECLAAKTDRSF